MTRYWVTVLLAVLVLCLLEGSLAYLQKPHIWVFLFIGSGVYLGLTWKDCRDGKDVKFSGGSPIGDLVKALLVVSATVGLAVLAAAVS